MGCILNCPFRERPSSILTWPRRMIWLVIYSVNFKCHPQNSCEPSMQEFAVNWYRHLPRMVGEDLRTLWIFYWMWRQEESQYISFYLLGVRPSGQDDDAWERHSSRVQQGQIFLSSLYNNTANDLDDSNKSFPWSNIVCRTEIYA